MSGATHNQPPQARPWNPNLLHTDRERWICVYPAYINSKKTRAEGRRLPKPKCVENPTYGEIKDICLAAGMAVGVENKVYPREKEPRDLKFRGRIRIQLKNEDGSPKLEKFVTRDDILAHLCESIPRLKSRQQSSGGSSSSSQQPLQASGGGKSKKKAKKNK